MEFQQIAFRIIRCRSLRALRLGLRWRFTTFSFANRPRLIRPAAPHNPGRAFHSYGTFHAIVPNIRSGAQSRARFQPSIAARVARLRTRRSEANQSFRWRRARCSIYPRNHRTFRARKLRPGCACPGRPGTIEATVSRRTTRISFVERFASSLACWTASCSPRTHINQTILPRGKISKMLYSFSNRARLRASSGRGAY